MFIGPLWGEVRLFRDVLRLRGTNNKIMQNSKSEPKNSHFRVPLKGQRRDTDFQYFEDNLQIA
jgi:hypothetical protein